MIDPKTLDWPGCVYFSGGVCTGPPDAGEVSDTFCKRYVV